jgi:hypothetical protein
MKPSRSARSAPESNRETCIWEIPKARIGYDRALGHGVDRVVAQCQDEVTAFLRMDVTRRRIVVAPSGVHSERFAPDGPAVPRDAARRGYCPSGGWSSGRDSRT